MVITGTTFQPKRQSSNYENMLEKPAKVVEN